MFTKAKNMDTAFRQMRAMSLTAIIASILLCGIAMWKGYTMVGQAHDRIYVLAAGKALEALASDRRDNLPVEMRDHVGNFHRHFFSLGPDEREIREGMARALYLADGSAKDQFDNLTEQGYYRGIVSGNISQKVHTDSVAVDMGSRPYGFVFHGRLEITRPTSTVVRSLVTEGKLREVPRSDNNPHGFLIERWRVVENRDMGITQR